MRKPLILTFPKFLRSRLVPPLHRMMGPRLPPAGGREAATIPKPLRGNPQAWSSFPFLWPILHKPLFLCGITLPSTLMSLASGQHPLPQSPWGLDTSRSQVQFCPSGPPVTDFSMVLWDTSPLFQGNNISPASLLGSGFHFPLSAYGTLFTCP